MIAVPPCERQRSVDLYAFHDRWGEVVGWDDPHLPPEIIEWFCEQRGVLAEAITARMKCELLMLRGGMPWKAALATSWRFLQAMLLTTHYDPDNKGLLELFERLDSETKPEAKQS